MVSIATLNTACVSGPFQQQVPETQWVIDESGNKQKISINANTGDSSVSLIGKTIESYYNENLFSKKAIENIEKNQELILNVNTKEGTTKALDNLYKAMPELYDGIYFGDMSDNSKSQVLFIVITSSFSNYENEKLKISAKSVTVKGLNGFIASDRLPEGFEKPLAIVDGGLPVFKINDKWKIDGIAIAKKMNFYEKA